MLECPSLAGVQAAVSAGLGVAALNPLICDPTMETWVPESTTITLPQVSQLIRGARPQAAEVQNSQPDLLALLANELATELEPTQPHASSRNHEEVQR